MPVAVGSDEEDQVYKAPFSNYAALKVEYPDGMRRPQPGAPPTYESSSSYDKEIRKMTQKYSNLTGRSDASSASGQSIGLPKQRGMARSSSTRKPDAFVLQEMAEAIGERIGEDQMEPAMAMLGVMTDSLFGGVTAGVPGRNMIPDYVQRPSPRSLEAITERVIQRIGGMDQAHTIRELVVQLTDAVFSDSGASSSGYSARDVHLEVRGLLAELVSELLLTAA